MKLARRMILVTGATGNAGGAVVRPLVEAEPRPLRPRPALLAEAGYVKNDNITPLLPMPPTGDAEVRSRGPGPWTERCCEEPAEPHVVPELHRLSARAH
jgi:hypothetical protein